jgi:hypothetical protein
MAYISKRLIQRLQSFRNQKILPLDEIRQAKKMVEEANFPKMEEVHHLEPVHGLYIHVFNTLVAMLEQMAGLPELEEFCEIIEKADEEYTPSGPPMSPLTRSFFNGWAFLDLQAGKDKETFASVILEVFKLFPANPEFVKTLRLLANSRMGLYQNIGTDGPYVLLKEVLTSETLHVYTPLRYRGTVDELWYLRLLPPPFPEVRHHTAFTTPYVFFERELRGWERFLTRTLPKHSQENLPRALHNFFKFGPSRHYWNEFVFEAHLNHQTEACYLTGLPDLPETRPHSRVSSAKGTYVNAGLL